jgi:transcriptional regulator GlxA family with amidase domain
MAAGMLEETSLPVTEVALSCGFKEVSLFDRQFGAAYGCPPLQYRRQTRGRMAD